VPTSGAERNLRFIATVEIRPGLSRAARRRSANVLSLGLIASVTRVGRARCCRGWAGRRAGSRSAPPPARELLSRPVLVLSAGRSTPPPGFSRFRCQETAACPPLGWSADVGQHAGVERRHAKTRGAGSTTVMLLAVPRDRGYSWVATGSYTKRAQTLSLTAAVDMNRYRAASNPRSLDSGLRAVRPVHSPSPTLADAGAIACPFGKRRDKTAAARTNAAEPDKHRRNPQAGGPHRKREFRAGTPLLSPCSKCPLRAILSSTSQTPYPKFDLYGSGASTNGSDLTVCRLIKR